MAEGRVIKALSGFYYVDTGGEVLTCRARGKFRKEGVSPLVGDRVTVRELGGGEGFLETSSPAAAPSPGLPWPTWTSWWSLPPAPSQKPTRS